MKDSREEFQCLLNAVAGKGKSNRYGLRCPNGFSVSLHPWEAEGN